MSAVAQCQRCFSLYRLLHLSLPISLGEGVCSLLSAPGRRSCDMLILMLASRTLTDVATWFCMCRMRGWESEGAYSYSTDGWHRTCAATALCSCTVPATCNGTVRRDRGYRRTVARAAAWHGCGAKNAPLPQQTAELYPPPGARALLVTNGAFLHVNRHAVMQLLPEASGPG